MSLTVRGASKPVQNSNSVSYKNRTLLEVLWDTQLAATTSFFIRFIKKFKEAGIYAVYFTLMNNHDHPNKHIYTNTFNEN